MVASTVALGLVPSSGAGAWPGDPDGSYGACGVRSFDVVAGKPSVARAAALQSDGKVLVAGNADTRGLVMRLDDGASDPTFGAAGRTQVAYSGAARFLGVARTAAGGVVAVGSRTLGTAVDSTVVRLKANGAVDSSFNGNGRRNFNVGGNDSARAVVASSDGSVLVAGNAATGGYVAKFTGAGAPDSGWGGDGRVDALAMNVGSIATRADGSVYVGGSTKANPGDWRIMRFASDGTVDTGFGGSAGITVNVGGHDVVTGIAVQPDGRVVAAGFGKGLTGHGQTIVRRYLDDGSPDPAFTSYRDAFGVNDTPAAMTLQGDGRILVAVNSSVGADNDIVLVRLGDDGVPDASFGVDGVSVADGGRRSTVGGVVVPPDGRPLAVGSVRSGGRAVVGAFRYQDDSSTAGIPVQGAVVDGFGGLHGWSAGCTSAPTGFAGAPYWPGWDIVRGVAVMPGNAGFVVDGFGGAHGFRFGDGPSALPVATGTPYYPGWDIIRGVAVVPEGTGGFELDGFGGLHAFSIDGGAAPSAPTGAPYWSGQDIARGVALLPDGTGGYIVDKSGGVWPFGGAPAPNAGGPIWPGQDVARGIAVAPDGSGGWIVDAFGGLHPFGTGGDAAPAAAVGGPYWPGVPIARGVAALP